MKVKIETLKKEQAALIRDCLINPTSTADMEKRRRLAAQLSSSEVILYKYVEVY